MIFGLIIWMIIIMIVVWLLVSNIRIVPQAHAYVVERLGGYKETWGVGLHFKIPILDKVAKKVSLKEQVENSRLFPYYTDFRPKCNCDA